MDFGLILTMLACVIEVVSLACLMAGGRFACWLSGKGKSISIHIIYNELTICQEKK